MLSSSAGGLGIVDNAAATAAGSAALGSGTDYQQQHHQSHHGNSSNRRGSSSSGSSSRRKSLLSASITAYHHHHHQQQQHLHAAAGDDNCCIDATACSSPARYSDLFATASSVPVTHQQQQHVQQFQHQHQQQQQQQAVLSSKYSLSTATASSAAVFERYEETCCLPPPSPAPNSDRFIVSNDSNMPTCTATAGIEQQQHYAHSQLQSLSTSTSTSSLSTYSAAGCAAAAGSQHMNGKYSSSMLNSSNAPAMQRCISPSVRYQHMSSASSANASAADRFRGDLLLPLPAAPAPKPQNALHLDNTAAASSNTCTSVGNSSRYLTATASSTHFLPQNDGAAAAGTSCTYSTYLSANVHTPVKRYVPTPPPTNELYTDMSQTPPAVAGKCSNSAPQNTNHSTLPYRYRVKCCTNEAAQQLEPAHAQHAAMDYYATSPRMRDTYSNGNSNAAGSCSNSKCIAPAATTSAGSAGGKDSPNVCLLEQQQQQQQLAGAKCSAGGGNSDSSLASSNTSPVLDYLSTTEVVAGSTAAAATSAATCLHCNTVRRTTGVHQTTQTTGPISPVPLTVSQHCASIGSNSILHLPTANGGSMPHEQLSLANATTTSSQVSLTANSSESHMSPTMTAVTQQQQHQTPIHLQPKLEAAEQQHSFSTPAVYSNQQTQLYSPAQKSQQQVPTLAPAGSNNCARQQQQQSAQQSQQRYSRKQRCNQYLRKQLARFFGVDASSEAEQCVLWQGRQRRLALRRFGSLKNEYEMQTELQLAAAASYSSAETGANQRTLAAAVGSGATQYQQRHQHNHHTASERPDILPAQDAEAETAAADEEEHDDVRCAARRYHYSDNRSAADGDFQSGDSIEHKASVASMLMCGVSYIIQTLQQRQPRTVRQWSRSFAPAHVNFNGGCGEDTLEGLGGLQEEEVFFDAPGNDATTAAATNANATAAKISPTGGLATANANLLRCGKLEQQQQRQQLYMTERVHGWRTSAIMSGINSGEQQLLQQQQQTPQSSGSSGSSSTQLGVGCRGNRISAQLLDGVLENSRRPRPVAQRRVELFAMHELDDRNDHRPFFTYWINTVQILVLFLSLLCYGIGPVGIGLEQKTGQVLVTSLSLQTVQHTEQRNVWIGPRNNDLVHMGAKFATCMRRDVKIIDVLLKTRRQERETACCIRNDDSGCVQSSQADCSVRGLFPTKSISTWKKWSPGESGPGGRISGSVCGLDPKYCDAPASIAPYEWPDDITKWPICRKANSFSQRYRYKDHTAEHMVCEVIGHPCCTGVYGECRITTREYCDFVNGYFHEEASLCSQISCLNNVCGMIPFFSVEVPDQFYRIFTSLCLHAGILHLAITVAFQHVFLADLERLIGPIRTAIVYIGSGLAGNLTSAVLVPYKPEVGPLASLSGVVASLVVLLILIHWKQLHKPHVALFKLMLIGALLFGIGTLPWQLNFAGLLAGICCGIFLTVALVPFVSISKYGRKAKINLIWSCIIFHLFIYTVMFVVFYVFPTELTNLNFGEVLSNTFNTNFGASGNSGGSSSYGDLASSSFYSNSKQQQQQQLLRQNQQPQLFYHHHHSSDDIIGNNVAGSNVLDNTKIAQLLQATTAQEQQQQQELYYQRSLTNEISNAAAATAYYHKYNINNNNNNKNNIHYSNHQKSSNSNNLNNMNNANKNNNNKINCYNKVNSINNNTNSNTNTNSNSNNNKNNNNSNNSALRHLKIFKVNSNKNQATYNIEDNGIYVSSSSNSNYYYNGTLQKPLVDSNINLHNFNIKQQQQQQQQQHIKQHEQSDMATAETVVTAIDGKRQQATIYMLAADTEQYESAAATGSTTKFAKFMPAAANSSKQLKDDNIRNSNNQYAQKSKQQKLSTKPTATTANLQNYKRILRNFTSTFSR